MLYRLSVIVLTSLFLIPAAMAGTAVSPNTQDKSLKSAIPAMKAGKVQTTAPASIPIKKSRVQSFLKEMERAKTLDEVSRAFKKYRFSQGEIKEIEAQIGKGRKNKLERFRRQVPVKSSSKKPDSKKRTSLRTVQAWLASAQQTRIDRLNRQAQSLVSDAGFSSSQRAAASGPSRQTALPRVLARGRALPETNVDIRQLAPRNGVIGQDLVIQGIGFGSSRGQVTIVVGPRGSSHCRAFDCPVGYWGNTRITVTIPLDCESMVLPVSEDRYEWQGREFAWIHVKPPSDDPGGFENLDVCLDPNRFAPRIESMNPDRGISPGQVMIIRGRNLQLGRHPHVVRFEFGGRRFDLEPERSDAGMLQVRLPHDIEGLFEVPGTIEVKNLTRLGDTGDITFIPAEEILEIASDPMGAHCRPSRPKFLCLIGSAHRHTLHDWTLENGWVVEDAWLETDDQGPNAGAYYIRKPAPGSTDARSRIEVWCDAYSTARTVEYLRLKGPRGTFRRSH